MEDEVCVPQTNNQDDYYRRKRKKYGVDKVYYIQVVYVVSIIIWILIIYMLNLYQTDVPGWIILFIPIAVFLVSLYNLNSITREVEDELFQINFISLGLVIILPLTTWIVSNFTGDKRQFVRILIVSLGLILLALVDVWVKRSWLSTVKHVKSAFQTMALSLLVMCLYLYYSSDLRYKV